MLAIHSALADAREVLLRFKPEKELSVAIESVRQ